MRRDCYYGVRICSRQFYFSGLHLQDMESGGKPPCQYGSKCYRKNERHLKEYSHVRKTTDNERGAKRKTRAAVKSSANKNDRSDKDMEHTADSKSDIFAQPKAPSGKTESEEENLRSKGKKRLSNSTTNYNEVKKKKQAKEDAREESKSEDSDSDGYDIKSNSWTYIKAAPEEISSTAVDSLKGATHEEIINFYYLVNMPQDFYSFFKCCESIDQIEPLKVLNQFGLTLVGPFDILAGAKVNLPEKELMLCHWRYYFDPPEFQTVLASDSGYHIGYWRDSPQELPVFLASNNSNKDCQFKIDGENIFGAVYNYLTEFIKTCDPFTKTKAGKFQTILQKWAQKENFRLEKLTQNIKNRQKKVNSKTFHGAGIVVPVQKKTEVGYRPLGETDANIKKLCNLIIDAEDKMEREALMEKLQPLITFANIANDECDFGNSLELGIDLFCMGSTVFDSIVEHLLTTAYSLLNRSEFGKIITNHLKNRRKDKNLSVL